MALINGDDYVSGDIESFQQNNRLKNHWRDNIADLTNPSPGMIRSHPTGEKLSHYQAAAWKEILQADTPFGDDNQIIGGDGSDTILIPYEETTNDAVIWGLPVDPKRGLIFCDVADIAGDFQALITASTHPMISIVDLDLDSFLSFGFTADDKPTITLRSGAYYSLIQESQAEGLAGSDTRIGLDEALRHLLILDRGDINTDLGLAAASDPTLNIFNAAADDRLYAWHDGTDANLAWTGTDLNLLPPAAGAVVIDGGANNLRAGLEIINLGTANYGIDLSNSGLAGATDYPIYIGGSTYWRADGNFATTTSITAQTFISTVLFRSYGNPVPLWFEIGANEAVIMGDGTAVGTFTACTVGAASAIVQHADIDTNTAIGDLLQIRSGTGVTLGFYRIIAVGVNQVTVDRNVSGAGGGDILSVVYQDVIGCFGTDGVNGQRIMNYSHQDKPLQIGGDTLQATVGMGSEDVVLGGITGYTRQGALYNWPYQGDLADDGTFNLPAFTHSCWGFIQAEHNEEYAMFTVDNDGDVILLANSANVSANADNDGDLCIGTAATQEPLVIKNRLGAVKNINLFIWYD